MRSVNKVILIGNLTRDPEHKSTTSGQSIVTFGMATNRQWKTSGGDQRASAEFHELVAWAKLAEICHQYLKKGMLVYVEGYLKTRNWDREDGTRAYRTEVVVQDMIILQKRENGEYDEMRFSSDDSTEETSTTEVSETAESASTEAAPEETPAPVVEETATPTPAETAPGQLNANLDDDNMF